MNNAIKNRISLTKPYVLQLSVIIVNFNVKYFLEQCLSAVTSACTNIDAEIIVVDNKSTDGSKAFFEHRFDAVKFIWNNENVGFSKANNKALALAQGEYILFLNPDTILPEDCLAKCLVFFKQKPGVGALGVRMVDGCGNYLKESKRGFPSPFTSICKLSGLTALFPSSRLFAGYYMGHLDQYHNHEVDVLSGAFMMVSKKVMDITGGFDERFFMYGEDIDLSYRIQKAGFRNMYFSESTILHFKGESTKRGSLNYVRFFYGAMSLFVRKHYSNGFARFYSLIIHLAIWINALVSAVIHFMKRLIGKTKTSPQLKKTLIIAGIREFEVIQSILQNSNRPLQVAGRIKKDSLEKDAALGTLAELPAIIASQQIKELIFCTDSVSAKATISIVGQLPAGVNCWFHFKNTLGIIGSKEKNTSGCLMT